jgi:hypothetical protein
MSLEPIETLQNACDILDAKKELKGAMRIYNCEGGKNSDTDARMAQTVYCVRFKLEFRKERGFESHSAHYKIIFEKFEISKT